VPGSIVLLLLFYIVDVCSVKNDPSPDLSIEEQAVRWKLRQLDINKNNV